MLRVKDIMTKDVVTVSPDTEIIKVAKILLENHFNGLPVVNEKGKVVGLICQSDLIVQQKELPIPSVFNLLGGLIPLRSPDDLDKEVQKMTATKTGDAMTHEPLTVTPESSVQDAATIMVKKNVHTLPVVEGGKLVGIIGKEDLLRTLMPSS